MSGVEHCSQDSGERAARPQARAAEQPRPIVPAEQPRPIVPAEQPRPILLSERPHLTLLAGPVVA